MKMQREGGLTALLIDLHLAKLPMQALRDNWQAGKYNGANRILAKRYIEFEKGL